MIQRYSRAEMREIWTEQRKLEIWLQIELLAAEALVAEGLVPPADFAQMKAKAAFTVERCKELEKTLNHDVIAFTTNVAENIGAPASRWLHFGLTSSDIVDTAFAVQMVQSADIAHRRRQRLARGHRPQGARAPIHADDRPQPRHSRRADHLRLENGADAR
jgi:adenylosuccinate lyase